MNAPALQNFAFEESLVRVYSDEHGEPWFVAKDILSSLGYAEAYNPARAIQAVPSEWKGVHRMHTPGGEQEMLTLSEQGLYFFLGRSDKPAALPFQKWLAGEVLPALRKTGAYALPGRTALPACELSAAALRLPARHKVLLMNNATQIAKGQNRLEDVREIWTELCNLVAVDASEAARSAASLAEESVRVFAEQCCENSDNPNRRVLVSVFYGAYVTWCGNVTPEYTPVPKGRFLQLLPVFAPGTRISRPRKDAPEGRPLSVVGLMLRRSAGLF